MQKNALTRLTSLYLCLMLTVFLLWPGTSGYAQIAEAKYRLFLWLTGGYCALSVLLWLELALIRRTAAFARPSLAEWLLLGYLLCSLIACLLSPWREETWLGGARHEGLLTIALYVLSFCLVRRFARPAAWMLDVLGAAITLFCAVAVLQLLGKNPFGLYPAGLTYYDAGKAYSGEYLATAGNAGFAAAILCTAIPALLFGAWRLRRWHLLVPAALGLAVAVWMNVSAGLAGLAGSILLTLPLALPKGRARKTAAFAVGGLILLALLGVWLLPNLPGMFGEAHALLHGEADPTFGSGRIYIWKNVWEAICARPWFGGGPDTLAHQVSAYFERYDADANRILRATIDAAHNEYPNIWANQGVFALLCWLGALGASAVRFVRRADEAETLICGSAVLGYCIQAFFGISTCISAPYLFLAWAMLEGQGEPLQDKIEKTIIGGWKR